MNKEELVKDAEDFLQKKWGTSKMLILGGDASEVLADFVEPREKQIQIDAEQIRALQKQNGELTDKVKELEEELIEADNATDVFNAQEKRIVDLEKENAELKAKNKWYADQVCNAECSEVWGNLTKAKDHIKKLLDCLKQDTNDPQTNYYVCQYMDKAEQFLKDCEVEK